MNSRATAQLGVGLLGIWAFIEALLIFPRLAPAGVFLLERGLYAAFLGMLLPFLVLIVLAYVFVFHAPSVARRILPPQESEEAERPADIACVLVGLAGVFIFVDALPGLLQAWLVREGFQLAPGLRLRSGLASGARAAIGLVMALRPMILVDIWRPGPRGSAPRGAV